VLHPSFYFSFSLSNLSVIALIRVVLIMGALDITSAPQIPGSEEHDRDTGEVHKVQNEDELRLAQMGVFP
jgi:hypothetical protein